MKIDIQNELQEYIDKDFEEHVKGCEECFSDYLKNFKPGSYGFFELVDRSMQAYEYFQNYCLDSCATSVDKEVYERAHKITQALWDFYQFVCLKDFDAEKQEQHRLVGEFFYWATKKIKKENKLVNIETLIEVWKEETYEGTS